MLDTNHYLKVLHLRSGAAKPDIKKAYRRYAFHFHPDRNREMGHLFPYIHEAYRALMGSCENGPHNNGARGKVNHNLSFVKETIKKVRPPGRKGFFAPILKVADRSRQCGSCGGYGMIGNHCLPMAICRDCLGTGLRLRQPIGEAGDRKAFRKKTPSA